MSENSEHHNNKISGENSYSMNILSSNIPDLLDLPEMTFELDKWGTIRSINNTAVKNTSYDDSDVSNGLTLFDITAEKCQDQCTDIIESVMANSRVDGVDYELKLKDGRKLPVLVSAGLVMRNGAERIAFSAMDMSGHKETEKDLIILEKLSALGELAGGVVHDFNNILAVILGYIHLHKKDCDDPSCSKVIGKIRHTALDGIEMVKRLQHYTQVNVELNRENMDINKTVEESLDAVKVRFGENDENSNRIHFDSYPGTVPEINANSAEMHEIVVNLLNNSVEAIQGEGAISISTGTDHGFATLEITDSGCGMSDEVCKRIFEPFFTTKEKRGTGLGMSILFGIINKMGGSIDIDSALGKGSTIRIFLPAAKEDYESKAKSASQAKEPTGGRSSNILVVDDESNICEILREFLSVEGYYITTASNGIDGLALYRENDYGIVITDLFMPGLSGWDMAARIREDKKEVTIVMLSGWSAEFVDRNKEEQLIDYFFDKPIDFKRLLGLIAGIVATSGDE